MDTFVAGLLGGWVVFGERNAVNEQVSPGGGCATLRPSPDAPADTLTWSPLAGRRSSSMSPPGPSLFAPRPRAACRLTARPLLDWQGPRLVPTAVVPAPAAAGRRQAAQHRQGDSARVDLLQSVAHLLRRALPAGSSADLCTPAHALARRRLRERRLGPRHVHLPPSGRDATGCVPVSTDHSPVPPRARF